MNKIILLCLVPLFVFSKVHYAKVEPYETVVLKSAASGLVIEVDLDAEGTLVVGKKVIVLDDALDKVSLQASEDNIVLLDEMLSINMDVAKSLKKNMQRQEGYYLRISKLTTASTTQKDNAYSAFISVKTQYLGTKEKIANLKKQIIDMKYKIVIP